MAFSDKIIKGLENVSGGFHAIPAHNENPLKTLPVMHRLFNIFGMVFGFSAAKYIADITFGCKVNGGSYEKIAREDVPWILKPLHNSLEYNPFSDAPKDQWRKVAHQMMPAIGGAVGAVGGSGFFFNNNGVAQNMAALRAKGDNIDPAEKAALESFDKGKRYRIGAGATAWLSAASGLTWLYGFFLNKAFLLCNVKVIKDEQNALKFTKPSESFLGIKPLKNLFNKIGEFFTGKAGKTTMGVAAGGAVVAGLVSGSAVADENNASNMTAEQYVASKTQHHEEEKKTGLFNGKILDFAKWIGNAALAVVPVHRMWTAVGLTLGGTAGLQAAGLLTGKRPSNGADLAKDKFWNFLQPLHGILGEGKLGLNSQTSKLAGKLVFATGLGLGAFLGSSHAYADNRAKDKKAESLEDFTAKISHTHGHNFFGRMAVAGSALFGSGSGMYLMPIPGENYGMNLAMRTVSEQDRKFIAPGLNGLTGNTTNSYMGVRESLSYLSLYAAHNPDKQPKDLEFIAHTIMGPLADAAEVKLTGANIKKFVDKVNEVRDKYWQEGGIPEDKKKEFMSEMKEHFKGKGFDKTLYECGIDSLDIKFDKIGGLIGKVANFMGSKSSVLKDQEKYHELVKEWRKDWKTGKTAEATKTQDAMEEQPDKIHARKELKKNITPVAKTKLEQVASPSMKKTPPNKETPLLERAVPSNDAAYSMRA